VEKNGLVLKQYNIFGEVEHIDEDGNVRRCQYCNKINNREGLMFCSDKCGEKSIKEVFESKTIKIDNNDGD
jgi:recombinational DNA repair protein RecR